MERWVLTLTQLLLPAAEETSGAHAGGGPHGVDLMHADGVGGADNGGDVMRFVHLLRADRQIRLPGREHFTNPRIAFRTHKR